MLMMFDEGVAGSFCGTNGSRKTDCRYERYHAGICRSTTESLKADAIRFLFGRDTETSRDDSHGKPSG